MDLDALLEEAAEVHFKAEPVVQTPKKKDPSEIKPFLASTALVTQGLREKWSVYIRKDHRLHPVQKLNFLPSLSYQSGDIVVPAPSCEKLLFDAVKASAAKCNLSEVKVSKLLAVVNPASDTEVGKRLKSAFIRAVIESLGSYATLDENYSPDKFPNLARLLVTEQISNDIK
jgi:hypothetical protein